MLPATDAYVVGNKGEGEQPGGTSTVAQASFNLVNSIVRTPFRVRPCSGVWRDGPRLGGPWLDGPWLDGPPLEPAFPVLGGSFSCKRSLAIGVHVEYRHGV